jgi:histidinol-phosphate aminotransferase
VERNRAHTVAARGRLAERLTALGIKVWPSEGNFLLVDFATPARAEAANAWLKGRGIIVRAMASYDLPHCLRITIGTDEEVLLVGDALADFVAANG